MNDQGKELVLEWMHSKFLAHQLLELFSLSGKNSLHLECNAQNTLSYIRQGGQKENYITMWINRMYTFQFALKVDFYLWFIKLCGVWKCKFSTSKKSSGCRPNLWEWWLGKQLALITIKGNGLWITFGDPEKSNEQVYLPHLRGRVWIWILAWCSLAKDRNFSLWMCGSHEIENFWSILVSDRLNSLIEDMCSLLRYPTHIFFSLSLILRGCRHHELSIVLADNFSVATGDFPCRRKTLCTWNATHRIGCHT